MTIGAAEYARAMAGPPLALGRVNARSMLPSGLKDVTVQEIPSGEAGTRATLQEMARLALQDGHHPEVISLARAAVRGVPNKDYLAEADRIFGLVRRSVRYVQDPLGLEHVQRPLHLLFVEGQGDCDDHATAIGALATALGHGFAFATVAADARRDPSEGWSHVYPLIGLRKRGLTSWVGADTTQAGATLGWEPPARRITAKKVWIVREP